MACLSDCDSGNLPLLRCSWGLITFQADYSVSQSSSDLLVLLDCGLALAIVQPLRLWSSWPGEGHR